MRTGFKKLFVMIKEIPIFEAGTYNKPCELFQDKKIGSVLCVGHSILGTKKCDHCVSYKENNNYYLEILKENTPIVSEVICNRPAPQLTLF
jgi:hypothetical protein